jgi:hypothetical protein
LSFGSLVLLGVDEREQSIVSAGNRPGNGHDSDQTGNQGWEQETQVHAGHKHHQQRRSPDQGGRPEVGLGYNQQQNDAHYGKRD